MEYFKAVFARYQKAYRKGRFAVSTIITNSLQFNAQPWVSYRRGVLDIRLIVTIKGPVSKITFGAIPVYSPQLGNSGEV